MKVEFDKNDQVISRSYSSLFKILLLLALIGTILGIFIVRTLIAKHGGNPPNLFSIFNMIIFLISLGILVRRVKLVKKVDLIISILLGVFLGVEINYSRYYPLTRLNESSLVTSILHGAVFIIVFLAGIIIMRIGGPVKVSLITKGWKKAFKGIGFGALFGLPLAIFNAYAFTIINNRPFILEKSIIPLLNAFQPGVIEEVVYRFTFLGILWLLINRIYPKHSIIISGIIATLVHNYSHFDSLFYERPMFALAYGGAVCLLFGIPMMILALKKDLETAIAFHWIQDAVRFMGGL